MKSYIQFLVVREDSPTNNAGGGHIDGIGVGPKGEPGVKASTLLSRLNRKKKKVQKK